MSDPAAGEPVEFVGGAPDAPRPKVWPYVALGSVLVALVVAAVILWGPIKAAGRGVGETVSPYSLAISGGWSASEKITGVPIHLVLTVNNGDIRTVPGLTVQVRSVAAQWSLLSASPHAQVQGSDVFFADTIASGKSETINLKLIPLKAGKADVQLTFLAGRDGHSIEQVLAPAEVRDLEPSDVVVSLTTSYDRVISINSPVIWVIGLENTGLVPTKSVKVRFIDLPDTVKIDSSTPTAAVTDSGKTLTFTDAPLEPGDKAAIGIQVTSHAAGTIHVTALVYIDNARDPVLLSSGASPVRFNVDVSPAAG